ncbi:hypothetical protein FRC20_001627 [Serendipita sp. 405]|nr:hypothetical protein FRC15_001555 [Serendipita sp. 397]KAG8788743.1 hypothetical protein FRC16_001319 [Serendipita sp. 398]KAG8803459.1 hypothetical protein FRC18_007305 [Serendipita sp. 400]KAG8851952.1 hypothetical protein FRC20_001627 [Serendipita sp. 405]
MGRYISLNDSSRAYVSGATRASNKEALVRDLEHVLLPHQTIASTLSAQSQIKVQLDDQGNNNGPISIKVPIPAMGEPHKVGGRAYYVIRSKHQEKTERMQILHARQIAIGLVERLMRQVECCQWVLRKPVGLSKSITRYSFDCALRDIHKRSKVESDPPKPGGNDSYTRWITSSSLRTDIRKTIAERTSSCDGTLTVDVIRALTFGKDQILIVLVDLRHKQAHQPTDIRVLPTMFPSDFDLTYIELAESQSSSGTKLATGSHTTEGPSARSNVTTSTSESSEPKLGSSLPTESKSKSKAAILEKRAYIEDTKSKLLIAKDILRALGKRPRTPEPCSPIKKQKANAMKAILSPIKATGTTNNSVFGTSRKKPTPSLVKRDYPPAGI